MTQHRRRLRATSYVEAVVVVSILLYGPLSLVAAAAVYWIDLLFFTARIVAQRLIARPLGELNLPFGLVPFRLLRTKRGSISLADGLPPTYPRNLPGAVVFGGLFATVALLTGAVAVWVLPAAFLGHPATPVVVVAAVVAAAAKARLLFRDHVATDAHRTEPATAVRPWKRLLLFGGYALVFVVVSESTLRFLADTDPGAPRAALSVYAGAIVVLRLAYPVLAPRLADLDVVGWLRSRTPASTAVTPAPPETPDGEPAVTVRPIRRSVLAAGVLNGLAAGGVVDGRFSANGLQLRAGIVFLLALFTLAALDGNAAFAVGLVVLVGAVVALVLASVLHLWLALGGVEYRLYDAELVAYDHRLDEVQWAVAYDDLRSVSVRYGSFDSPLWLDTGTVSFERADDSPFTELDFETAPRSLVFLSDPENVAERLRQRSRW